MIYTLINYFDVYKEADGTWAVNNQCAEADGVVISETATDKDICTYLYNNGYLTTNDMRRLEVIENGEIIEVYQKKDFVPLFGFYPNY